MVTAAGTNPSSSGVRARAQGVMKKAAGGWPCKLAHVAGKAKQEDAPEGFELHQVAHPLQPASCALKAGQSPTSVTDGAWDFMPRGGLCIDSVAAALHGSTASQFLAGEAGVCEKGARGNQTAQRYGGGVFASIRGAHNSWQVQTESDAAQARQKHAISFALGKGKSFPDNEAGDAREVGRLGKESKKSTAQEREGTSPAAGSESLMGRLMKGLQDQDNAATWGKMARSPGYTGVRASAFALVSSNAVAAGRPAPERHCEAPPRVPLHQPSTKEGVAGMAVAARRRPSTCEGHTSSRTSDLMARRPEGIVAASYRTTIPAAATHSEW
jgi:hypothetical protein